MVSVLNGVRTRVDSEKQDPIGICVLVEARFRTTEVPAQRSRKGYIATGSQREREIHQVLVTECRFDNIMPHGENTHRELFELQEGCQSETR